MSKMVEKHLTMTRADPFTCTTRSVDIGAHSVNTLMCAPVSYAHMTTHSVPAVSYSRAFLFSTVIFLREKATCKNPNSVGRKHVSFNAHLHRRSTSLNSSLRVLV